ncbi:hypothetical protein EIL87_03130 [Saccharopolyspora rhizosphaerae]|uniref:Uncharacterized protein n=1 Tax=Saccharopolyspora rhizosphaerae TaxID=2492662 RepID=A0A3R8QFR4_9PSEU|nr:hypothetical protein [Saccharopolyspora rhizosphaerae]RRO19983.1 hypothetical protein EIL87_03130 [Saccharopolyspora rhizosphaerae]
MSDRTAPPPVASPPFLAGPPLFDSFWPSPEAGAPRALLTALLTGLAAALFIPLDEPGIG